MGKGDQKTRRGKLFAGSYGKRRPRKAKKSNEAEVKKTVKKAGPKPKATPKTEAKPKAETKPKTTKPKAEAKPKTETKAKAAPKKTETKAKPKKDKE